MSEKKINQPHLTALERTSMSVPTRWLKQQGLLKGRILDFGCGHGVDTEQLKVEGYDIMGYDNYYRPEKPAGKFDTIICVYVLNVLEPVPQADVLMTVSNWLNPTGKAYFAVRRDIEREGFRQNRGRWSYQCTVRLPFRSIHLTESFEIYEYTPFNQQAHPQLEAKCVFCQLSKDVELICETATMVSFFDKFPVSKGHALIIPKRHVANYFELTAHEQQAMQLMLNKVKTILDERFHPDGYNIGVNVGLAAGQSVFHVHMHLIPRYTGDVKRPKGGVRGVIPDKQNY